MTDLLDDLHEWYAAIDANAPDADELIARAVTDGRLVRRRRTRMRASIVTVACVALAASAIAIGHRHTSTVRVSATRPTTAQSSAQPVATAHDFPDLDRVRAWLADAITRDAQQPPLVRAEIVQTTLRDFDRAELPTSRDTAAPERVVYAIQLTGTTFACNSCGAPLVARGGAALRVAWDPTIRFVADHSAGDPIDLAKLGRVYSLDVGRPTTPAPTGPVCGQNRGRAVTIASETRLDHTVNQLPQVFTPPGRSAPAVSARQALDGLARLGPNFLAPKVDAILAVLNAPSDALVKGPRLVWILSVTNVEVAPNIGLPQCGNVAVVIDATTNSPLVSYEGGVKF
jgi:hypothetical protein